MLVTKAYGFTNEQWQALIAEGLHVALLDDVGAKTAAASALSGYCYRNKFFMSGIHRLQLANEINTRMWDE